MKLRDSPLVEDDGVIAFNCDKPVVKRAVMQRAQADSVFQFIRSALMVNWNDVRRVHKVELHSADCAPIAVSSQHVLSEARITHLPIDLLQHRLSRPCWNVIISRGLFR